MIASLVSWVSVYLPTTLAKVVRSVIGLVIFITVPTGAVLCSASMVPSGRLRSSIQTPTPCSFIWRSPYRSAGTVMVGVSLVTLVSTTLLTVAGGGGGGGFFRPCGIVSICPSFTLFEERRFSFLISSTVVSN